MNYCAPPAVERIEKHLFNTINSELSRVGVFFRIFSRVKTMKSLDCKIKQKNYLAENRKLQDAIGIRIVLYFPDDIDVVVKGIKSKFKFDNESVTDQDTTRFSPTNLNIVFRIPDGFLDEFDSELKSFECVDATFEVQIRTILSEGWHEVEHDLRYKCTDAWGKDDDLSRMLNGVYASLLTSEWSMEKLFSELSYRHYKRKNWDQMIRNKYRLRFDSGGLSSDLNTIFNRYQSVPKQVYRFKRSELVKRVFKSNLELPVTLDNLVYVLNFIEINNNDITRTTPNVLIDELERVGL